MRSLFFVLLMILSHFSAINAAECTNREASYADSVWAAAADTSDCIEYVTTTDPVIIDAPCTATDCLTVMEGVAEDLPNCTYSGINNKIEVQNALTSCIGGDIEDAGSPSVSDSPTTTNDSTTSMATAIAECSPNEITEIDDLYNTAAETSACSPYSTTTLIDPPCAATDCIDVITQLAKDLPYCAYDGVYLNVALQEFLDYCIEDSLTSTPSNASCSITEGKKMWKLYTATAMSDACAADATVNGESVDISTPCDSECAGIISELADSLPDCYYDYEGMSKKEDLLQQLQECKDSTTSYLAVTMEKDSSIEFATSSESSRKSDSNPSTTDDDTNSNPFLPGGSKSDSRVSGSSDKRLESSKAGSGENTAPQRVFNGVLQLSVIFTVLAYTVL